jgi:hypothetical protein
MKSKCRNCSDFDGEDCHWKDDRFKYDTCKYDVEPEYTKGGLK